MSTYGKKLDPHRSVRKAFGLKGIRQSIVVTNNPSTIDANQLLTVRFPNLGVNDAIVPLTLRWTAAQTPTALLLTTSGGRL